MNKKKSLFFYGIRDRVSKTVNALRRFQRSLSILTCASPITLTGYISIAVVTGVLPVLQVWLFKLLVDDLTRKGGLHTNLYTILLAALYSLTFVLLYALEPLEGTLIGKLQNYITAEVDRRLIEVGTQLVDLVRVEDSAFQDEVHLLQITAGQLAFMLRLFRAGSVTMITLIGSLFLIAHLSLLLALIMIIVSIPHIWAEIHNADRTYMTMFGQSRAAREMDYYTKILTEISAAKEIRVFGLGDFFLERFKRRSKETLAEMKKIRIIHIQLSSLCSGLYVLTLGGGLWYVIAQASMHHLTLGDIALYLNTVLQGQSNLNILALFVGQSQVIARGMSRLFSFQENAKPSIMLSPKDKEKLPLIPFTSGINLQKVSFSYPIEKRPILEDINIHLKPGTITALIGENGAGKSTLVKLLTRMYDPVEGVIQLDNTDFSMYNLLSLRNCVGAVYQDFARFSLTLRENIIISSFTLEQTGIDVEQAAYWSGLNEVASKLPQGYETPLTHKFGGGVELSGGEWQRVALARCFIRNASFVILDEPTSSLDPLSEKQLIEHFRELIGQKIGLLISHRFSTVRLADQILVLERGRIIEKGTHEELLAANGTYANWYEIQAEQYRDSRTDI